MIKNANKFNHRNYTARNARPQRKSPIQSNTEKVNTSATELKKLLAAGAMSLLSQLGLFVGRLRRDSPLGLLDHRAGARPREPRLNGA